MAERHWTDGVKAQVTADIERAKEVMRAMVLPQVRRQPNVRPQIVQAIAAPEQYPMDARSRLAAMLYSKYGEQARNVLPYLGLDQEAEMPTGGSIPGGF